MSKSCEWNVYPRNGTVRDSVVQIINHNLKSEMFGAVVVGWLGRASTTLHCTHHVTHEGSRNTSVSFSFPTFVALSSLVTVGGDRAILSRIVTSAVQVLLICLSLQWQNLGRAECASQPWLYSFGVHCWGVSKTVLASFGVVGIVVTARCQADAFDDNPPRAFPTENGATT